MTTINHICAENVVRPTRVREQNKNEMLQKNTGKRLSVTSKYKNTGTEVSS